MLHSVHSSMFMVWYCQNEATDEQYVKTCSVACLRYLGCSHATIGECSCYRVVLWAVNPSYQAEGVAQPRRQATAGKHLNTRSKCGEAPLV